MRLPTLAALALLVGCGPGIDPLIGSYTFAMTAADTNTAPNTAASTSSGTGTLAITSNAAMTGYVLTVAHNDTNPCVVEGTIPEKTTTPEITVKVDSKCTFYSGSGTTVATITSGKAVLKLMDTRAMDTMTLDVAYSYAGTTPIFNVNFAGNGKRTYTGTRR